MQKGSLIEYRQKDGDVVYRVQYRDAKGRQVKESIGRKSEGWTKRKVQAALAERISNVANRGYRKPEAILFRDYADRWFEQSQLLFSWKPNTVTTYKTAVKRLKEHFGHRKLGDIERSDINTFAADLLEKEGLAPRSVNLTLTVLYGILNRAVEEEKLIQVNPARGVKRPKEPDYKPRYLSAAEARSIEAKITDPTVRLAFVTFELLGLRFMELRNLRWGDVDLLAGRLRVEDSKTPDGERSMSIPKPLVELLMQHFKRAHYQHASDFVFCHYEKGSRLNPARYRNAVKEAFTAAGLKGRFRPAHDLRVTSATSGILTDEHPTKAMTRHGWKNYSTYRRYQQLVGQVFPEEAETLAAFRLGASPTPAEAGTPSEV